ncbi:MAG TPA: YciI family protein [Nevskiaceae bacterium]|nr:YciI family protein [Nevskiaceae bacterium]
MLLIVEDAQARRSRPVELANHRMDRMNAFADGLRARGILKAAESLASDAHGARISASAGKRLVLDGPFAEAKEIVGGFFLLEVATREEAVAIGKECPAVEWATVEVRQLGPCGA